MPRTLVVLASTLMLVTVAEAGPSLEIPTGRPSTPVNQRIARNLMERLPLAYEVNRGQAPQGWDFLVRCRGYHAFVNSTGVVFSFDGAALSMSIDGADKREPSTKGLELPGKANYFIGNDPSKWISNAPLVRGARYADAAPGTSWSVGGDGRALEFAFDVEPGAAAPRLRFEGGSGMRVAEDGSLRIAMPTGEATISAPVAWQDTASERLPATARFVVDGDIARIDVARLDPERPVHVDPTVTYATYLGGEGSDGFTSVAMDSSNNVYCCGTTVSTAFPTTGGAYNRSLASNPSGMGGNEDVVVTKFNSGGSALVYSTYIGGTYADFGTGVAVDSSGNAFVRGFTGSTNYPITSGVYLSTLPSAGSPGFVTEVASTGSSLVYSTFTNRDGDDIAIGPSGSVYVQEYYGLSRYSAGGVSLVFATPIPANPQSSVTLAGIAADANGDAYVVGDAGSGITRTAGAFQTSFGGGSLDAFLAKINSNGSVVFVTLLGGTQTDYGDAVGVNLAGQAYVVGRTTSSDFPVTSDAFRTSLVGSSDNVYVTRFNAAGSALRYSTYVGLGTPTAIRVHPYSSFVVGGYTSDSSFPATGAFQGSIGGGRDGFLMKFERNRTLAWSSFCGGSGSDTLSSLGMAPDGSIAAAGSTGSTDFPTVSPYQSTKQAGSDGFVLAVSDTLPASAAPVAIDTASLPTWTAGYAYDPVQLSASGGVGPYAWSVVSGGLPGGMSVAATGIVSGTPTQTGTFTFKAHADDPSELLAERQITLLVNAPPSLSPPTMPDATIGTAYDRLLPIVGGSGNMLCVVTSGAEPPGTSLSGSGHVIGTPTQTGSFSFGVMVTDGRGATGSATVSLHVNDRPTIAGTPPAGWTEGRPFSFQFQSFGGSGARTWSVVSGTAPTLTPINTSTGRLSGTTRPAGVYDFTVRATDTAGATIDGAFTVTVNPAPQITTTSLPTIAVGRPYSVTLQLSGGTPPFDWFAAGDAMPPGLSIGAATGLLDGVVTGPAIGFVTFTCNDVTDASTSSTLLLQSADAVSLTKKKATQRLVLAAGSSVLRYLELTAGALLGVQVTGGAAGDVRPELHLFDGTGAEIDLGQWTRQTSKSLTVKGAPVPSTGRFFLTVLPPAAFAGKLTLAVTISPATTFASHGTIGPTTTAEFRFSAPPGATLSISAKAPRGSLALPKVVSVTAPDGTDLVPGGKTKEKRASATFTSKTPLAGGDYRVVFAARDANAGDVAWTVKLKTPKKYLFSMPDVPAGE